MLMSILHVFKERIKERVLYNRYDTNTIDIDYL